MFFLIFFWVNSYPQSDVQNLIKGGELVINGYRFLKAENLKANLLILKLLKAFV